MTRWLDVLLCRIHAKCPWLILASQGLPLRHPSRPRPAALSASLAAGGWGPWLSVTREAWHMWAFRKSNAIFLVLMLGSTPVAAALRTQALTYHDGDTLLEGYLAYDEAIATRRPAVLVVHEWKGLGEAVKRRAEQLARLGYVGFAVDMYGKGVLAKDNEEAGQWASVYINDRAKTRQRIQAALSVVKQQPQVDPDRIAAIGYCFGGMVALELARSGAPVAGVLSFHGKLSTPQPADARQIQGRVLVFHGGADPFVSPQELAAFRQEMQTGGVHFRVVVYDQAVHSFTMREAGADPSTGVAYDAAADRDSWQQLEAFLREIFGIATLAALAR